MKKKRVSELLTESEIKAVLRVQDRRKLKGKRDYALFTANSFFFRTGKYYRSKFRFYVK